MTSRKVPYNASGTVGMGDVRKSAERQASDRGDTLIEILLALIVLAIGSLAVFLAFTTSINASATHRNVASANVALAAVTEEAQAGISSQLSLFSCPTTLSNFTGNVTLAIPAQDGNFTAAITSVQWWNGTSFSGTCVPGSAEQFNLTVTNRATNATYATTFVVEYPLGTTVSQDQYGTVPSQLVFKWAPGEGSTTTFPSGAPFDSADQPIVYVEDQYGRLVSHDSSPVILSLVSATNGTLSSCSGPESGGIVNFSGCLVTLTSGTSGTFSLQATDTSISNSPFLSGYSFTVTTSASVPRLVFLSQPTPGASGAKMTPTTGTQFQIAVQQNGTTLTSWTGSIALATSGSTAVVNQLSGCVISGPSAGVFSVSGCSFMGGVNVVNNNAKTYYTMTATATATGSSPQVLPGTSAAFGVTGPGQATQLIFAAEPVGGASATLPASITSVPIVVEALDSWGNTATGTTGTVSLSPTPNTATNILGQSVTEALSSCGSATFGTNSGFATFSSCSASAYAQNFKVTATFGSITQVSTPFNVTGLASSLKFTTQPQAGPSGTPFVVQPVLGVFDQSGYVVTDETASITTTPTASPATTGVPQPQLTGCTDFSPTLGYFNLSACSFVGSESTPYTMTVTLGGLTATSASFSPNGPGAPAQLVFAVNPVAGAAGSSFSTQPVILIEDIAGNLTSASNVGVTLSASGGNLTKCSNLTSVAGVVNVANCQFGGVVGQKYTLLATSTGLASATSSSFSPIASGAPAQLAVSAFPSGTVAAGSSLSGVAFAVQDIYGNVVSTGPGSNDQISVALGGSGTVSFHPGPNVLLTAVGGVVTLTGEAIDTSGSYTMTATDSSETLSVASTVITSPLTVVAAAPTTISFAGPGGGTGGIPWSTQPTLTILDAYGNVVVNDASTASLAITSNPSGATLSGCSGNESNGVISFVGCNINKVGTYQLTATDAKDSISATSLPFTVSLGAASQIVFSQEPAGSVTEGTPLTSQPIITVEDAGGNPVTSDSSTVSLTVSTYSPNTSISQQGGLSGCTQSEKAGTGVITFAGCTIAGNAAAGSYTLKATDSNLSGVSATSSPAFSIVAGLPKSLAFVSAPPTSATAGSALSQFKVAVEDINGNEITGGSGAADSISMAVTSGPGGVDGSSTNPVAAVNGVATFTNIVLKTPGLYTLTASDLTPGDTGVATVNNSASPTNVVGVSQTITWTPPTTEVYTVGSFTVSASDTAGSQVTFAASGYCTVGTSSLVSGTTWQATVTITGAGNCAIMPTATAQGIYAATAGTGSVITITPVTQTITWTPPTTEVYTVGTFTVSASDTAGTQVTFAASGVCTVGTSTLLSGTTWKATVTITGGGNCTITPTATAVGVYGTTVWAGSIITIAPVSQTITWTPPSTETYPSSGGTFTVSASDTAGTQVTFAASGVCSVGTSTLVSGTTWQSTVTMTGPGNCSITPTATASANGGYSSTSGTATSIIIYGYHSYEGHGTTTTVTAAPTSWANGDPVLILVSYNATFAGTLSCSTPTGYGNGINSMFAGTPQPLVTATNFYLPAGGAFGYCAYTASISSTIALGPYSLSERIRSSGGITSEDVSIQVIELTGDTNASFISPQSSAYTSTTRTTPTFAVSAPALTDQEIIFGSNATATTGGPVNWVLPTSPSFTYIGTGSPLPQITLGSGTTGFNETVAMGPESGSVGTTLGSSTYWGTLGIDVKP